MTNPAAAPRTGLADAIDAVRRELQSAQQRGEGEPVRFKVGAVELELQVELGTTVRGEGGIQVWVVSAKGSGERTSTSTHTVRVQLTPLTESGADLLVSDQRDASGGTVR